MLIVEAARAGTKVCAIARQFRLSELRISFICKVAGLPRGRQGPLAGRARKRRNARRDLRIVAMRKEGLTLQAISSFFRITLQRVWYILAEAVARRSRRPYLANQQNEGNYVARKRRRV